ncbi:hypothetical protein ACGFJC_12820 [Nonomuraea fuscirosea]|uniref:hypothetical protein n=1 Tax=Nonomuraea fuscirosea TaxID=1291556 RepID=UPI0034972FC8
MNRGCEPVAVIKVTWRAGASAGTSSASVRVINGGFLQLDYVGSADADNVLVMLGHREPAG